MKLTTIFLLAACLQLSAKGVSQTVSITVKDVPLLTVLKEIKKQTGYFYLADNEWLQKAKNVTLSAVNWPLQKVLDECFKGQPLTYNISGKVINIVPREEKPKGVSMVNEVPPIDVRGRVVNENGEPAEGVTVTVKGTVNGTTTNSNGEFFLKAVDENAILAFTSVNMETIEVNVKSSKYIDVALQTKVTYMQEIVINKGYYTETKKLSTGNVAKVTSKDIQNQPVQNPLLTLQGRVPGLYIIQNTGLAGGSINIRIQGQNSILGGKDPLYIIDGVPIVSQLTSTGLDYSQGPMGHNFNGFGSPLNFINPADIESMEILKDADATAIYGSRAANGAILITTKKGKAGKMKFDASIQTGWGKVPHQMKMLNTRQYLDMRYEALNNDGLSADPSADYDLAIWDTTKYTNWQKQLIGGTARYNDINLSFSGGVPTIQYFVSGTYHGQTTVFPFPKDFSDKKGSVHVNLSASSNNQRFKLQFSGSFISDHNKLPSDDITRFAVQLEPNAPQLLNADGSINWALDSTGVSTLSNNPMALMYTPYKNSTNNLISNLTLGYDITKNLKISAGLGANWMNTEDFIPYPLKSVAPDSRPYSQRAASFGERRLISWITEPQLSYKKNFGRSKIDALIGSTFQLQQNRSGSLSATGQLSDDMLESVQAATLITANQGIADRSEYRYNALFGRLGYAWNEKYVVNLTARRDGSSRFGGANRFSNFGSVGAAWVFSSESFFQKSLSYLSFGKLRGSYGTTGNDQIGDYRFLSTYTLSSAAVPYQGIVGLQPITIPNPYLQWEETKKLQFGLDLGFFTDRVLLNVNYARNRSSNLLLNNRFPYTVGLPLQIFNLPATVQNINWEFAITTVNVKTRNFVWNSSVNLTIPKNKLVAFPSIEKTTYVNSLVIGLPISIVKTYKLYGVDPQTGDYLFLDKDNKPTATPASIDRIAINLDPKYYGGFQNTITFKRLQLDFLFQFVKQMGQTYNLYNGTQFPGEFYRGYSNQPVSVLQRWRAIGDISGVRKFSTTDPIYGFGDGGYGDASFIRLKNVSLSWNLTGKWCNTIHFRDASLFCRAQNLLTITKYKGLDPETQSISTLPPLRVITVGVNVGL